jgi:hypothetical protein
LARRELPAPQMDACSQRPHEAPRGEVEEILAAIWEELLGRGRIGRDDHFFELGGHSLLVMQMMERLRRLGLSLQARRVFECPRLADLAAVLTGMTAEPAVPPNLIRADCTAITPEMLTLVSLTPAQIDAIVRSIPGGAANIQDVYPLAPLQEGILFHHLLDESGGDAYVLSMVLELSCRERLDELLEALQLTIDRHDVLRTAILWTELPRAVQVVHRRAALPVEYVALDPGREPLEQLQEWVRPEQQRLNLQRAPLMRAQVAGDPAGERHYLLLQTHHITSDHVTLEIITRECVEHMAGRAQQLSARASYRDHVARALAYAASRDAEAFFRGKLADVSEPSAPFGLTDVHQDGGQIHEARDDLSAEVAAAVRSEARRVGVSAATMFHAAWAMVVAHTSGRDDIVFGSVLLGRLQSGAQAQQALGLFINTLPVRLRLLDQGAKEFVEQTQRELVDLLGQEQASLAIAQRCSALPGAVPLFSSLLNYRHNVPQSDGGWSEALGIRVLIDQERTNYPITVCIDDWGQGFTVSAQTDKRISAQRVVSYVRTAVESLVAALAQAPQAPISTLSILPEQERAWLIRPAAATRACDLSEPLISELFEEQVARTPDAIAVSYEGEQLTYAQLNARANQLARYLRARGVGSNRLVGLCVERGLPMVIGIVAVLKAGGAYVPLDPNYPAERLEYMLRDASPAVVLIEEKLRSRSCGRRSAPRARK